MSDSNATDATYVVGSGIGDDEAARLVRTSRHGSCPELRRKRSVGKGYLESALLPLPRPIGSRPGVAMPDWEKMADLYADLIEHALGGDRGGDRRGRAGGRVCCILPDRSCAGREGALLAQVGMGDPLHRPGPDDPVGRDPVPGRWEGPYLEAAVSGPLSIIQLENSDETPVSSLERAFGNRATGSEGPTTLGDGLAAALERRGLQV
jgi:hypothetical protein